MRPYYDRAGVTLFCGDNRRVIPSLRGIEFDAVITDPPYGLSFMGRDWDHEVPGPAFWRAMGAVMKPGAHLASFGGTRTQHRIAVAIEDAGFEIRDTAMWLYGEGFPKGQDIGKLIDKAAGAEREVVGPGPYAGRRPNPSGGVLNGDLTYGDFNMGDDVETAPATEAAKAWSGWNTQLKPAYEPILVGYKPVQVLQFLGIIAEDIRRLLCQILPASDAERLYRDHRAISSEVHDSVPENARIYELENSANVQFAAQRFTYQKAESGIPPDSVPQDARANGNPNTTPETEIHLGAVEDFRTRITDTYISSGIKSISPSTVLSWNSISDDLLNQANRFTTSTGIRLTTELTTLRLFLHQIISEGIGNSSLDLKPAYEPIIIARKPMDLPVHENVLKHGTGAMNIEATRVGTGKQVPGGTQDSGNYSEITYSGGWGQRDPSHSGMDPNLGRWPANVMMDETAGAMLDEQSGFSTSTGPTGHDGDSRSGYSGGWMNRVPGGYFDNGGASRFFYCAKATRKERGELNLHPTVKPIALMRYLIRMFVPKGAIILEPFAGSGTTLIAAAMEGVRAIGIEQSPEYCAIIKSRLKLYQDEIREGRS